MLEGQIRAAASLVFSHFGYETRQVGGGSFLTLQSTSKLFTELGVAPSQCAFFSSV
jgi:hypothetical protein